MKLEFFSDIEIEATTETEDFILQIKTIRETYRNWKLFFYVLQRRGCEENGNLILTSNSFGEENIQPFIDAYLMKYNVQLKTSDVENLWNEIHKKYIKNRNHTEEYDENKRLKTYVDNLTIEMEKLKDENDKYIALKRENEELKKIIKSLSEML